MKEIKVDFNKLKLVPVEIVSVEIDDTKISFICDTKKRMNKNNSMLIISNVAATSLSASTHKSGIHIVSTYVNLDTNEKITVHERTFGEIKEINSDVSNSEMTSFEIVIDEISPIEYSMEVKTRDEEIDDAIKLLQRDLEECTIEFDKKLNDERKLHKKDMEELFNKINRQDKEFKEFKDRIYKAFGIGELHIGSHGISGAFNLVASSDK